MLNVEFFGIIFLIVYVGAIAVLFLFVVMMLDIKVVNTSQKIKDFFSYRNLITGLILIFLLIFINEDTLSLNYLFDINNINALNDTIKGLDEYINYSKILKHQSHLQILGTVLYRDYIIPFLLCGFILFISMVGAIVVTLEDEILKAVKQQNPVNQGFRSAENSIFNFKSYKKN
jgi:NADH-quinone oxidoreductase subunit J